MTKIQLKNGTGLLLTATLGCLPAGAEKNNKEAERLANYGEELQIIFGTI